MDLRQALEQDRAAVEAQLEQLLVSGDCPERLMRATGHGLAGGKKLRAFLVMESARLCGACPQAALRAAAAVEALHAYSLVHDDLPAMDDDALRRGQPTVHVAYDEATAILAGDGLQALAFQIIAEIPDVPPARLLRLSGDLARAAGLWGMVGGQMRDIAVETRTAPPPDPMADVALIQSMKTGALISWSAQAGAVLAGAPTAPLAAYARALGLGFQLRDDLLDIEGSAADLGKAVGKDAAAGKATYVSLLGVEAAKAKAQDLADEAKRALEPYGAAAQMLAQLADYAVTRTH